jgi:type II secretory pathway component PulJ
MRRTRSRFRRTSAAERGRSCAGFTIVELAITCALLMVVLGVLFNTIDGVIRSEAYTADRTAALDNMRITLNRMTRELRQASSVAETASTASRIEFDTYGTSGPRHVVYEATGTSLTRSLNGGSAVTVLTGVASTNLFTYVNAPPVPGAQWVRINLQVRPKRSPETILVLDSEVNLRNRTGALT